MAFQQQQQQQQQPFLGGQQQQQQQGGMPSMFTTRVRDAPVRVSDQLKSAIWWHTVLQIILIAIGVLAYLTLLVLSLIFFGYTSLQTFGLTILGFFALGWAAFNLFAGIILATYLQILVFLLAIGLYIYVWFCEIHLRIACGQVGPPAYCAAESGLLLAVLILHIIISVVLVLMLLFSVFWLIDLQNLQREEDDARRRLTRGECPPRVQRGFGLGF